jgi:hypothetical protein
MLTYRYERKGGTVHSSIGPCMYAPLRMSIIGACKRTGREIPAVALEEDASLQELREANLDVLLAAETAGRKQAAKRATEQPAADRLPPAIRARVLDLRGQAASIRDAAQHADSSAAMQRELEEADRIATQINRLIAQHRETA